MGDEFKFKTEPYAHQKAQWERHRDSRYFALFDDMGTGKTKITIDVAAWKFLQKQVSALLIIAPNHVHEQWVKEQMPLHCPVPWRPWVWSSGRSGQRAWRERFQEFIVAEVPFALKVLAVNVEAFQSDTIVPFVADFVQSNECFIVVDEGTRIKHHTAKRSKTIHKLAKYGHRAILTGTPTAKSPFDLWSMMEFLKAGYFGCNFFIFQHRYGIMVRGTNEHNGAKYQTLIDEKTYALTLSSLGKLKEQRGSAGLMPDDYETVAAIRGTSEKNVHFIEAHPVFTRFKRLDELKEFIAKDVSSVRKEDCLDLPEKVYERILVDMTPEQKRVYTQLKRDLIAQYADKELTVLNKVALTTRLMQVAGGFFPYMEERVEIRGSERVPYMQGTSQHIGDRNSKLDAIRADLDEVDDETRVIVWAHFVPELKMLYKALKDDYSCCLFYGGTPDRERSQIIEDFQRGVYKIFVGNPSVAGFGLNLQNATLQYYFSNSFRTEDRLQAEDRSHRIGVKSTVVYKDVIARGTLDEKVHANISAGRDMNDYFKQTSLIDMLKAEGEEGEDGPEF